MVTIRAQEFESRNIHRMIDEVFDTPILLGKCMRISMYNKNKHIGDVVHEIVLHISKTNTDYIFKKPEEAR